ncbi:MAG TPA: SpoIIE family protein phosphatase [Vicinamibacteria bacterium]|nr:SpoIIE family protein phosphatase [Vicinamibacteria bacterium]
MDTPVVFEYQRALDEFRRASPADSPFLKRMSELISLLDITTSLSSSLSSQEILEAALLMVLGELQCTRGCILARAESGRYRLRAGRGLPPGAVGELALDSLPEGEVLPAAAAEREAVASLGLEVLCPILRSGRVVAVLGLGPRAEGRRFGPGELAFLRSVAACAATPIENGLIHEELQRVNQRLSVKIFQLQGLFDISRELTASLDEEAIASLLASTLMGQLTVSRCALLLGGSQGLRLAYSRGIKGDEGQRLEGPQTAELVAALRGPTPVDGLPESELRRLLIELRLGLLVPLRSGERAAGLVAVGQRVSGLAFSDEDYDFAQTLARQAMAAFEAARLHRLRVEKQRRDRELQIAREIQQSLFPRNWPAIPGFEVGARSESCHEVGGDHYDVIPLERGRVAVTIADVSGKGTPASLLMASVHAWLRALAGTTSPPIFMERLNRFLFASTQANKYVTLFYAELEPASRRLVYVNGGHVPPFLVRADGRLERLLAGGTALGLLEEATYEAGEVRLEPGDALVMVTDGATEASSPQDVEFGDQRIFDNISGGCGQGATALLERLVDAVHTWNGSAGCTDDLTVLVLKAQHES